MKKLFALKGRNNSGKSATIRFLRIKLLAIGFSEIKYEPRKKSKNPEFKGVYEKMGVRIGITTIGDVPKMMAYY